MNRVTRADLYRYDGLTGFKGFLKGLKDPGFRYVYLLRKAMPHKATSFRGFFFRVLKKIFAYSEYQISNEAQLGEGFYLYHKGTVIIGPVKIGKNCCVSHNITIGRSNRGGVLGRPTIGDNVWIGPNCVLVGGITIGNNVLIAPNTFVNFDVPDDSIVIGSPGTIKHKPNATKNYIQNILPDDK